MGTKDQQEQREIGPLDFDGAAVINPDGSETAITEDMIKAACDDIESSSADNDKSDKNSH